MTPATLIIFGKSLSEPVKTRLAGEIGLDAARDAYERLLVRTIDAACATDDVAPVLCLAGSLADESVERWRERWPGLRVTQQVDGDLGQRMAAALRCARSDRALLVGTDCPGITPGYLADAAAALDTHDAVLGPVADGGYVLIGVRQVDKRLFEDIVWSTDSVARVTRNRIRWLGWSLFELEELWDVDTVADYDRWLAREID